VTAVTRGRGNHRRAAAIYASFASTSTSFFRVAAPGC